VPTVSFIALGMIRNVDRGFIGNKLICTLNYLLILKMPTLEMPGSQRIAAGFALNSCSPETTCCFAYRWWLHVINFFPIAATKQCGEFPELGDLVDSPQRGGGNSLAIQVQQGLGRDPHADIC